MLDSLPLNGNTDLCSHESLDRAFVKKELGDSHNRFVDIPGVSNVRTLGGLTVRQGKTQSITRENYFYRSSSFNGVNASLGKEAMQKLKIKYIFDLRSDEEGNLRKKDNPQIAGVCCETADVFSGSFKPDYQQYVDEKFDIIYTEILEKGGAAFRKVFKHIIDKPVEEGGFVFHCSAGKDRTGVLAALLLKLAGVSDADISKDYALTRIGREDGRDRLMKVLDTIPFFQQIEPEGKREKSKAAMLFCKPEYMRNFLEILNSRFNGVEEYVKANCQLTNEDVEAIKKKLVVSGH